MFRHGCWKCRSCAPKLPCPALQQRPFPAPRRSPVPPSAPSAFLADARLVLQTPENPRLLQTQPLNNSVIGQVQALEPEQNNVILGNGAWGLLVRVRSTTGDFIPYALQLRRETDAGQELVQTLNSDLRQQVSVTGSTYQADAIVFNGDERIPLLPGRYELRLVVKNPDTQLDEIYNFPLEIPAFGG